MIDRLRQNRMSRRQYLLTAAATTVGTAVCRAEQEQAQDWIDAHVHVWTPDVKAYPLGKDYDLSAMQPKSFTPDQLFAHCRPQGVNRIVLIQMSFYQFDNRYMLDSIRKYPQTFRGVAVIDHEQPKVGETMRQLQKQGVSGFRLYANAQATAAWLGSSAMAEMWKQAAETGQAICLLANPDALPSIEKLCRKFPQTRVVVDHFARIGVDGQIRSRDLENLCRLASFPQTYVKTSAFYALGKKKAPYQDLAPMILRLRDAFGAERLMWASDCPYQVEQGHTYAASISLIRDQLDFLSEEEKAWMLRKTAHSVYWA
ncbi:MAG: amidohydrolase family protein [Blastopirellula sp. JB062]